MEDITITETESRYFGDLFLCCDVEKTGKIPFLKATELFRSANLSNDVIRQITSLSGIPQTALHISRSQFYSCLKLIAAHQASVPLRTEVITSSISLPLPRFSWKDSPPLSRTVSNAMQNPTSSSVGLLSTSDANGIMSISHTSQDARQWREVRSPDFIDLSTGARSLPQETMNSDLQSTDSEVEHNETVSSRPNRRHRSGSPEAWSTNSDSPTPTNSAAERFWAKDSVWQGLFGDEHRQLLGTEEESSDRHSSEDENESDLESIYQINNEQREYYTKQFKAVQPDPNGLLSGHIARVFFEKSRIPVEELRHIWQLCDVTRDGALSLAEFTAAMHLVVLRRNNIPLPSVLPSSLNPAILNTQLQAVEPPEADLLHLGDDDKTDNSVPNTNSGKEKDYKRLITVHPEKSLMTLSSVAPTVSQLHANQKPIVKGTGSPVASTSQKNRSLSNSPHGTSTTTPPSSKPKDVNKDWANQNREWTKFTESPTSNVSSPGPKPVNFDMQRTAQAVGSDPQILHPVPLRVTPVGAEVNEDDCSIQRMQRKCDTIQHDSCVAGVVVRETDSSPKLQGGQYPVQNRHRDSLQGGDLRAIQRPQPKKLPSKNIGAIPPPPQRESLSGSGNNEYNEGFQGNCNVLAVKKEPPPLPPPRPHRHARSSSLDLNKLKMGGTPPQSENMSQNRFEAQGESSNHGFADFTQFHEPSKKIQQENLTLSNANALNSEGNSTVASKAPLPRPTISSLQTSQRVSAFEVYRKPNTPRTSQSPEHGHIHLGSSNNTSSMSISSGAEYERRVAAISETLRHVSFKQDRNIAEVLRHLKEQNVLLLKLCNDLSEELLMVQQRKEEIRTKIESSDIVGGAVSLDVPSTASTIVHSNV